MKTRTLWRIVLIYSIVLTGCKPMSIMIKGDDCKMNGGFEVIKNGLPANWYYYAPETVPNSDFKIIYDSILFKDGKISLNFNISKCESVGSWHSPGFFKTFKAEPGETYKVSLWVINKGCTFNVKVETGMKGIPGISETFIKTQETISDWKYFEHTIHIPMNNDNIRFEVNILSPGTIWFDNVRINKVTDNSEVTIYPYRGDEECK